MSSSTIELRYLDPAQIKVWMPEGGSQPHVELEDRCLPSARLRRAFPLSSPKTHISVQDSKGKEVGILSSLDAVEPESRKVIEEELDRRYFSPRITKIDSLKQDAGMWLFHVQTQRGPAEFYVRNWRDSAYEIGNGRWQIHSVEGLRYEILRLEELDERSQQFLDQVF